MAFKTENSVQDKGMEAVENEIRYMALHVIRVRHTIVRNRHDIFLTPPLL